MRIVSLTIVAASVMACGASGETQFVDEVKVVAQQVLPGVERAVGLKFKYPPAVAVRTREEVHAYLLGKLATDFPEEEMGNITQVYHLLGAIPGDLDLRGLVVDLYTEQVVGYYDPSTDSLYVVAGSDPAGVRLVVAHELVHALQAQYIELDSILSARGNNDARVAVQAVLEGDRTSVEAGGAIGLRGKEFGKEETYTLHLLGALNEYDLGEAKSDGEGQFELDINIPDGVRPGAYQVVAVASDGDVVARLDVMISAATHVAASDNADQHTEMADSEMDEHQATADEIRIERDRNGIEWAAIGLIVGVAGGLGIGLGRRSRAA